MSNEQTRLSSYIKRLQDHPVISLIIFVCICLMGVSAFVTQMDSGYSTISKRVSPPAPIEEPASRIGKEASSKPKEIEKKSEHAPICNKCNEIFARGVEYIAQGRISKPSGSNAYESYLELKQIDPFQAENLLEAMRTRLRQLVQSAIRSGNLSNATRHLNTLTSIDSKHDTTDLLISIKKKRAELPEIPPIEANANTRIKQKNNSTQPEFTVEKNTKTRPDSETVSPPTPAVQSLPPTNPTKAIEAETKTSNDQYLNEWISAACTSISDTYDDSAKVGILQTTINDEPSITGTTLYKLYFCADIYDDSYKLNAIRAMAKKMTNRSLSPTHYSKIISDFYDDSYKSSAAGILIPYIKK